MYDVFAQKCQEMRRLERIPLYRDYCRDAHELALENPWMFRRQK